MTGDPYAWASAYLAPEKTKLEALLEQDEQLKAAGWHPLSNFWRKSLVELFSPVRPFLRFVARVGRRGGKSTTLDRVIAMLCALTCWQIPPGDVGCFPIFNIKVGYAEQRLDNISRIYEALGVDHKLGRDKVGRFLLVERSGIYVRAMAASFRTAVGFTAIGFLADELARWIDEKTGKNPASHVLGSVRPAMATQLPYGAAEFLISSPWSTLDAHYDAFELGNTEDQRVAWAPSWVANPSLTEETCKRLARMEAESGENIDFEREYRAIPMTSGEAWFFDHAAIENAAEEYELGQAPNPGDTVNAGADFGFRSDSSALVVVHRTSGDGVITPADLCELRPAKGAPLKPSETVRTFATTLRKHSVPALMADGHYAESVREHLNEHGLQYVAGPTDVPASYVRFRALLHQGKVRLPKHKQLLRDLKEVQSKPTATGRLSIHLPRRPGGGHCDLVSALVLACWPTAGHTIPAEPDLPDGWTLAEVEEVEAVEAELRRQALGALELADDDGWADEEEGQWMT